MAPRFSAAVQGPQVLWPVELSDVAPSWNDEKVTVRAGIEFPLGLGHRRLSLSVAFAKPRVWVSSLGSGEAVGDAYLAFGVFAKLNHYHYHTLAN